MPKSNIYGLNIFATVINYYSCNYVFSNVYDYMIKACHDVHNYMIKAFF